MNKCKVKKEEDLRSDKKGDTKEVTRSPRTTCNGWGSILTNEDEREKVLRKTSKEVAENLKKFGSLQINY